MPYSTASPERTSRMQQFLAECSGWRRLLEFLRQENSYLKTRLSMMLDFKNDREFLLVAEQYQSTFLLKDDFFMEVLQDVKRHEEVLKNSLQKNTWSEDSTGKKHKKLRNEIEFLEKDFTRMKDAFNKELLMIL